jgi:hypothetical protein
MKRFLIFTAMVAFVVSLIVICYTEPIKQIKNSEQLINTQFSEDGTHSAVLDSIKKTYDNVEVAQTVYSFDNNLLYVMCTFGSNGKFYICRSYVDFEGQIKYMTTYEN